MANEQARQFIEQATQSVQSGQFAQALALVDQAVGIDQYDPEAHILRGICLAQLSRPQEATEAFRSAISIDTNNPKGHYNLAVHAYMLGRREEAMSSVRQTLFLDPQHSGARDLLARMEAEAGGGMAPPPGTQGAGQTSAPRPGPATAPPGTYQPHPTPQQYPQTSYAEQAGYPRPGESGPIHTMPFVANMGGTWVTTGWILALLSLVSMIWSFIAVFPSMQEAFANPNAQRNVMFAGPIGLQLLSYGSTIAALVWTIIDLADRKGNFLWVLPQVLCGCCGFSFITLPVYLLAGRK